MVTDNLTLCDCAINTSDLLQSDERVFTVYLKPKGTRFNVEVMYGPYNVDLTGWVSTGLRFKKGTGFRVQASGKLTYVDAYGKTVEMFPTGHGYWKFFVLKGKIGNDLFSLGSSGGGTAKEDGMLELGAPRVSGFFPQDAAGKSGSWQVYVFATDAVKDNTNATKNQTPENKIEKRKKDLDFLKQLLQGEKIADKSPGEIAQQVKAVISAHGLRAVETQENWLITNVKTYYENYGQPSLSVDQMGWYKYYLKNLITELQAKIDKQ